MGLACRSHELWRRVLRDPSSSIHHHRSHTGGGEPWRGCLFIRAPPAARSTPWPGPPGSRTVVRAPLMPEQGTGALAWQHCVGVVSSSSPSSSCSPSHPGVPSPPAAATATPLLPPLPRVHKGVLDGSPEKGRHLLRLPALRGSTGQAGAQEPAVIEPPALVLRLREEGLLDEVELLLQNPHWHLPGNLGLGRGERGCNGRDFIGICSHRGRTEGGPCRNESWGEGG